MTSTALVTASPVPTFSSIPISTIPSSIMISSIPVPSITPMVMVELPWLSIERAVPSKFATRVHVAVMVTRARSGGRVVDHVDDCRESF